MVIYDYVYLVVLAQIQGLKRRAKLGHDHNERRNQNTHPSTNSTNLEYAKTKVRLSQSSLAFWLLPFVFLGSLLSFLQRDTMCWLFNGNIHRRLVFHQSFSLLMVTHIIAL
jgi:hypothetical protein